MTPEPPSVSEDVAPSSLEQARGFADDAVNWLCELPDRSSPEDWPRACLVTGEELHEYLTEQVSVLLDKAKAGQREVDVKACLQEASECGDPSWNDAIDSCVEAIRAQKE